MKTAYGVPVPRGVPKDWEANSMTLDSGGAMLRKRFVPPEWGDPVKCVAWFDRFGRCRACVGHYANGRSALMRADANGVTRTTFSNIAASVDRSGEAGETATQIAGSTEGESVVPAKQGDAQPSPSPLPPKEPHRD